MQLTRKRLFDEETVRGSDGLSSHLASRKSDQSASGGDNIGSNTPWLVFFGVLAVLGNRLVSSFDVPRDQHQQHQTSPFSVRTMIVESASDFYDSLQLAAAAAVASWSGLTGLWWPLLGGLGTAVCMWSLVYLDSDRPGVRPPSPLRPPPKTRYRSRPPVRTCHLNYMMSLASGVLVFCLLLNSQ